MSKYDIYFTKQDALKCYKRLEELEKELGLNLDWKKVKRQNGDNIHTLLGILERKAGFRNRCKHCAYLVEDDKKNWVCDIDNKNIEEINFCDAVEEKENK